MTWHILDAKSIWIKEFASALSQLAPVVAWSPDMYWAAWLQRGETDEILTDPPLHLRHFPLQRGYSAAPLSSFVQLGKNQTARMAHFSGDAANSPLICTTPYYAPVAEKWPGPVIYYLTDFTKMYAGANPKLVTQLDRRMCAVSALVCPNSARISDYLQNEAGCSPNKIVIIPQATRASNLFPSPPTEMAAPPADIAHLPRPIAGVSGNLATNQDWVLMLDVVNRNSDFSWVFVGPTEMKVYQPAHRKAREQLMSRGGKVVFTGAKPYGELRDYARCYDVALLPYQPRREPTYSGSSTRFYEHLAACRPMLATRGFEELLHKEPLLKLVDQADEVTSALAELRSNDFRDGLENLRWEASQQETWENRAFTLKKAFERIMGATQR